MEVGDEEDYHFAFEEKTGVVHIPTEIPALEEAFEKLEDAVAARKKAEQELTSVLRNVFTSTLSKVQLKIIS